jgi:hypothetical protein
MLHDRIIVALHDRFVGPIHASFITCDRNSCTTSMPEMANEQEESQAEVRR